MSHPSERSYKRALVYTPFKAMGRLIAAARQYSKDRTLLKSEQSRKTLGLGSPSGVVVPMPPQR